MTFAPQTIKDRRSCSVATCDRPSRRHGLCDPHSRRASLDATRPISARLPTMEARFWAKVERGDECWRWVGADKGNGYGIVAYQGRVVSAHRVAYELFVGPIPDRAEIDHLCHNRDVACVGGKACPHRRCVNPDHLEAVTGAENRRRGQGFAGRQSRQTHCIHGHPFDDANTYTRKGHRLCKRCARERDARSRAGQVA